jgi:Flp pilus assembly protein TadG
MTQKHSASRKKGGQALAEMAVMVPFLIIGMMGMLDLGRAFYYQIALTNAVREAARYATQPEYQGLYPACNSIPPATTPGPSCPTPSDTAIQARVNQELSGTGFLVPAANVRISPDQAGRTTDFNASTPTSQYAVTVSASFQFRFITPIIGSLVGDPLTINSSAAFRAEY